MLDGNNRDNPSAAGGIPNAPKRRKVRKGTQSCWECKRRKIRCTFAAPTDVVCDGCRSRQTRCVSQEFHDAVTTQTGRNDRLGRIESLVEQLIGQNTTDAPVASRQDGLVQNQNVQPVERGLSGGWRDTYRGPSSSIEVSVAGANEESQVVNDIDDLSRALLAVWPSQNDLDLMLGIPVDISVLFHGVVCQPYSKFFSGQMSSRGMLQPPAPGSHPVLIARKLLLLASFLQGVPPRTASELTGLDSDCSVVMLRLFNTATRLVTSNDELINSLEGVESVMIESMYLNNAGNLRRAWLSNRRAMVMAQMLGLHSGTSSPDIALENETRNRIYPDYMWFRLVVSDRYLSLMLGLPQGSVEDVFAHLEAIDNTLALERMERMESAAAGLILQRNREGRIDLTATFKIDRMLQEAANLMPPQWWHITPKTTTAADNDGNAFEETIRLMFQFTHHHLLVQLHLPYMMMPSSNESSIDYSKVTATNASRAILELFVSFRGSSSSNAYCRGVDFIAFTASTTLCLAHIEVRRRQKTDNSENVSIFQTLRHQRLSDRGLLERTLDIMEVMARSNRDAVAQKTSAILRPLLAIEDNSFKGGCYHVYASSGISKQDSQCIGETSDAVYGVHIHIPYFGTIRIEHRPAVSDSISLERTLSDSPSGSLPMGQAANTGLFFLYEPQTPPLEGDKGEMSAKGHPVGYGISKTQSVNADWQTVPSFSGSTGRSTQSQSVNREQIGSPINTGGTQEAHLLVPGLEADVEDWALQGVDMALFSNLMQDSADLTNMK